MPFFDRDGLRFHYRDEGEGLPFVFQHGLGGDVGQPFGLFRPPPGVRLLAFDARGHGETRPLGDPETLTLNAFADDLIALLDQLGLVAAVIGGISMGAAVALNTALRHPDRALGLVLSRPAWLDQPLPPNARVYPRIARLITDHGAREGLRRFRQDPEYLEMLRTAPDCAQSLVNQFEHPRAEECVARLERIPRDTPCHDRAEWGSIRVPTLILGNRQDPIHPWEYAEAHARGIPRAELRELTSKSVSPERHAADVQRALADFLQRHFPTGWTEPC
jgi:pimeloyl-ACP methyl ester carboxylesterase